MNKSQSKYFHTAAKMDEALLALLEKKDFAYITVKELCETAGVNRSTFYLHYETIDDLLEECVDYMNNKCFQRYSELALRSGREITSAKLEDLVFITPEYLKIYLEFVRENKLFIRTAMTRPATIRADKTLERMASSVLFPVLDRFHVPEKEKPYYISFYIQGTMAIVAQWLKGDCADPIEQIIRVCMKCVRPEALSLQRSHPQDAGGAPGQPGPAANIKR